MQRASVMMRAICVGALTVACIASCSAPPSTDAIGTTSSPIQGGTTDTTHLFAVGVVQLAQEQQNMVAFCTGVLLAPNLVATARHCVAMLGSTTIDCMNSTFGALFPANEVLVTTDTNISMNSTFATVTSVIVPSGADQTAVCGNDIALMILADNIDIPQYVEPVISPPMTDPQYEHVVTAIGYGIDTPTDMTGMTAGTRRIKENVQLTCIPNDTTFADCFTDQAARQVLTGSEFVSGDSTCEGDSGSGAFEQGNFDQGKWVAFGVLSRGGVSTDGMTCEQPIYSRFDAWGPLIVDAAQQAAAQAAAKKQAYPLAVWAGGTAPLADAGGLAVTFADASDCATGDCVDGSTTAAAHGSGGCDVTGGPSAPGPGPRSCVALLGLAWAALARRRRTPRS
jgi:V8-like Glu-specific endopeptidase